MSSNIYYFDETGKPKIKNEIISVENELNSKQLKENNKLKGKSCLNIFFYTWLIIVIFLIGFYMLLYYESNSEENQNKKSITKKESLNEKKFSNKKIGIAFVFKEKFINGIELMLSLLMNKLAKNEKYDIYLISNHNKIDNFEFNKNIKIL